MGKVETNKTSYTEIWKIFLILCALSFIFFFNIIFQRNYFFGDFMYQYYPWRNFLAASLSKGVIPQWNSFALGGMPFIGDIQNATFYLPNWLLAFFVKNDILSFFALEIHLIFHLILGGIFIFLLARELQLSFEAALFSTVSFTFGGFLITKMSQLTLLYTFIYLPLIFYLIHKSINEERINLAICGGFTLAISFFAGGSQYSLHIIYFVIAYSLFLIFTRHKQIWYKKLVFPLILLLVGGGIAIIQILPTVEFTSHTVRETMTYTESVRNSLPLSQFITILAPKFFGSFTGAMETDTVPFWGESGFTNSYWETWIYLGLLPLVLMFFSYRNKKHKNLVVFLSITVVISLLAAMGKYTPVYWIIYHLLPGFNKFRIPGRFAGTFTFSALLLSGIGFDIVFKKRRLRTFPKSFIILLAISAFLFLLLILGIFRHINIYTIKPPVYANMITQTAVFYILIIIALIIIFISAKKHKIFKEFIYIPIIFVFIDLFIFGHSFNLGKENPYQFYRTGHERVRFLKEEYIKDIFRINARAGEWILMPRNAGNVFQLELLQGYNPLRMKNFSDLDKLPFETKLNLLNTKYAIKVDTIEDEKTIYVDMVCNKDYIPRAFIYYSWVVVSDKSEAFDMLSSPNFDYKKTIILEEDPGIKKTDTLAKSELHIYKKNNNEMEVTAITPTPGILFFSELYYPEWKVYLNNEPVKIMRANYAFRAIALPAGKHKLNMVFESSADRLGKIVSLVTIILSISTILIGRLLFKFKRRDLS